MTVLSYDHGPADYSKGRSYGKTAETYRIIFESATGEGPCLPRRPRGLMSPTLGLEAIGKGRYICRSPLYSAGPPHCTVRSYRVGESVPPTLPARVAFQGHRHLSHAASNTSTQQLCRSKSLVTPRLNCPAGESREGRTLSGRGLGFSPTPIGRLGGKKDRSFHE